MLDYTEVRLEVLAAQQIAPNVPCQKGMALCCDRKVPMLDEDKQLIDRAIKSGALPKQKVQQALDNLADPNKQKDCPLLEPDRSCMLHTPFTNDKPLVCIFYGKGGTPVDDSEFQKVLEGEAPQPTYNLNELIPWSCESCIFMSFISHTTFPAKLIQATTRAVSYGKQHPHTALVVDFVKEEFPKYLEHK